MLGAATFSLAKATVAVPADCALALVAFAALVWRPVGPLWLLLGKGFLRVALHAVGLG